MASAACAVVVVGGGALTWACTAVHSVGAGEFGTPIVGAPPGGAAAQTGPVGSMMMVSGKGFSWDKPVEVHWNSLGGPVLATTTPRVVDAAHPLTFSDGSVQTNSGTYFSVNVTIPNVPAGSYDLVVTGETTPFGEAVAEIVQGGFQVTPSATMPDPVTVSSPPAGVPQAPVLSSGPATANRPAAGAPAPSVAAAGGPAGSPAPVSAAAPSLAAPGQALVATDQVPQSISALALTGDLWSGFGSGASARRHLSVLAPSASTSSGPSMTVGAGLLGGGLLVLALATGGATVVRRRAIAGSTAS